MKINQYYISNYSVSRLLSQELQWKDWHVQFESPLQVYSNENALVLGFVFNPFQPNEKASDILKKLSDYSFGTVEFWDFFNSLSGRFVMLFFTKEKYYALNDAFSQRQIFYAQDPEGISLTSSPKLYYESTKKKFEIPKEKKTIVDSLHYKGKFEAWFPSSEFIDAHLKRVLSNFYLELPQLHIHRIPFHEKKMDKKELFALTEAIVKGGYRAAKNHFPNIYMGLTAGGDSRLLGALLKNERPQFFTYFRNSKQKTEVETATKLAKLWNLPHSVFNVMPMKKDFQSEFYSQFLLPRRVEKHANFQYLKENFPKNSLLIAAYGGEEIRGTVAVANPFVKNLNSLKGLIEFIAYPKSKYLTNEIKKWLSSIEAKNSQQIFEYFHWEMRSSISCAWYSYEQDFSGVEIFNPFCNRLLVKSYYTFEPAEKRINRVFKDLMEIYSPETKDIAVNPMVGLQKWKNKFLKLLPYKSANKLVNSSLYSRLKKINLSI